MKGKFFNLAQIRPWWLRLLILFLFASPLFGVSELPTKIRPDYIFSDLGQWSAYAVFVWLIVWFTAGLEQLIAWLSVAVIFGLTVAFSGAALRKSSVWEVLETFTRSTFGAQITSTTAEGDLVLLLIRVMTTLPIAILALQSFPPADILRYAARPGHIRAREWWIAVAIFVRVFQHVFEVAGRMLLAWREENPQLILPRFRGDWANQFVPLWGIIDWLKAAVMAWSVGLLQQALLFVPVAVRDWGRFMPLHRTKRKGRYNGTAR